MTNKQYIIRAIYKAVLKTKIPVTVTIGTHLEADFYGPIGFRSFECASYAKFHLCHE